MSRSLALTRRDPRRDAPEDPDWTKLLLVVAAIGAGVAVWWRFGRTAQASPQIGPGGTQPGPGPGNVPAKPSSLTGADAAQGDLVAVSPEVARGLVPGAPQTEVVFLVTGASPGTPVLLAQTTGNPPEVPAGVVVPIPRAAITRVSRGGGAPSPTPPAPKPASGAALVPVDLGSPMPLRQGHHYRARLQLSGLESTLANPGLVAQQFATAGFTDVKVYRVGQDPLPADWPLVTIAAPADAGSWFAEGTWPNPDASVPRPPQVVIAWEQ